MSAGERLDSQQGVRLLRSQPLIQGVIKCSIATIADVCPVMIVMNCVALQQSGVRSVVDFLRRISLCCQRCTRSDPELGQSQSGQGDEALHSIIK
jgi:hypothetical protein